MDTLVWGVLGVLALAGIWTLWDSRPETCARCGYRGVFSRERPSGIAPEFLVCPSCQTRYRRDGLRRLTAVSEEEHRQYQQPREILVVSPEYRIRRLVQVAFEHTGLTPVLVDSAVEALVAIENHRPDLVVSQIKLPVMSGVEVAERLHADPETRGIPIILLGTRPEGFFSWEPNAPVMILPERFNPLEMRHLIRRLLGAAW